MDPRQAQSANFHPLAPLPPSAQEIADVIGRELALYLIGRLPASGSRPWRRVLYVPHRLDSKSGRALVEIIGQQAAERLCRHFSGAILQPANCTHLARAYRDRELRRMAADGAPVAAISEQFGMSRYRVQELLRAQSGEPPEEQARSARKGGRVS